MTATRWLREALPPKLGTDPHRPPPPHRAIGRCCRLAVISLLIDAVAFYASGHALRTLKSTPPTPSNGSPVAPVAPQMTHRRVRDTWVSMTALTHQRCAPGWIDLVEARAAG